MKKTKKAHNCIGVLMGSLSKFLMEDDEVYLEPINIMNKKDFMDSVSNLFDVAKEEGLSFQIHFANGLKVKQRTKSKIRSKK